MSTDLNLDFPELPRIPEGLDAAVFILQARNRLRLHRDAKPSNRVDRFDRAALPKALSIRAAARRFNCSKSSVGQQLRSLTTTGKPYLRLGNVGRPRSLTNAEEDAVVAYAVGLCRGGFDAGQEMVIEAANTLRRRRSPPAGPVSEKWFPRFLRDHPELKTTHWKPVEMSRKAFELEPHKVEEWFKQTAAILAEHDIQPSDMWNVDECGIRIGCVAGRTKVVIVRTLKAHKVRPPLSPSLNNSLLARSRQL